MLSSIKTMETAPRDGTRILVKHHIIVAENYITWKRKGTKWEECRWVEEGSGNLANFMPWCGDEKSWTRKIQLEDCIGWVEVPEVQE